MTFAVNLLASGLAAFSSRWWCRREFLWLRPPAYNYLPTNTPMQAIAGDMLRVGTQFRLAQKEREFFDKQNFLRTVRHG